MDIRGIEVTNQLRSAIRAKLLELGVRYDEELPDYILVMVVNKKTRQQMHEDLHLFLEDNTAPFVDWLHDQVLKKLQKVTVVKKKTTREFVPSVIVKQEEERRKRKIATSFLEDHSTTEVAQKLLGKDLKEDKEDENKEDKQVGKEVEASKLKSAHEPIESAQNNLSQASERELTDDSRKPPLYSNELQSSGSKKIITHQSCSNLSGQLFKANGSDSEKHQVDPTSLDVDKNLEYRKCSDSTQDNWSDRESKKLKSSVCKPKVTSVVSIKNRLGIVSPKKKFEFQNRGNFDNRLRYGEHQFQDTNYRNNFSRTRNLSTNGNSRRSQDAEAKVRGAEKTTDIKQRLGSGRDFRPNISVEKREKIKAREKIETRDKTLVTIKNRLGASKSSTKMQEITKRTESRRSEIESSNFKGRNVKYRLGPIKKKFRAENKFNFPMPHFDSDKVSNFVNLPTPDDLDDLDDEDQSVINVGPIKSHVVAVKRILPENSSRKRLQSDNKEISDAEDENFRDCKVPSKVIVTPRPLKPLQPTQKRATQSLLLRAVAEANQSVAKQKNPEPSLEETMMPPLKISKPSGSWAAGQNLSVHLDAKKRFVMEKIQIELTTVKTNDIKSYSTHEVTDEHIGVLKSLFQQSNNNQKFLVTLSGYNNDQMDKNSEENQECSEMEVQEYEELELPTSNSDVCRQNESDSALQTSNVEEDGSEDDDSNHSKERNNDENQNTENIESIEESSSREARKLSPIIYNRSRSPTPDIGATKFTTTSTAGHAAKKIKIDSITAALNEESTKRCRYWPNCTLGNTCGYYHPGVLCSVFPACKFGKNCTYLHPKCKFGLSCTKIGCIFSHSSETCKYHPYCKNLSCPYLHPLIKAAPPTSGSSPRAKFTWRRRN